MKWLAYAGVLAVAVALPASALVAAEEAGGGAAAVGVAIGDDGNGHTFQFQIGGQANLPMQVQVLGNGAAAGMGIAGGIVEKIKVAYLGVMTSPVPEVLAEHLKLAPGTGLLVEFVEPGSPAATAEIRRNDILMKLDDQVLVNLEQLQALVQARKPKDKITVTLIREGKEQKVAAELGERETTAFRGMNQVVPLQAVPNANPQVNFAPGVMTVRRNARNAVMADGMATSSATMSDGDHTLTVTVTNGQKHLTVKDKDGKVLFDGPINTRADRQKVPPEILKKLDQMENSVRMEVRVGGGGGVAINPGGGFANGPIDMQQMVARFNGFAMNGRRPRTESRVFTDGDHSLDLSKRDGGKYLVAKGKDGQVVFEGAVQTDEQRKAVPPEILKKLETLEKSDRAEVSLIEDGTTVTIVAEDGRQRVTAKDAGGKVLFEGPVNSEDERARMPEKIRTKVEKLWKSCATVWNASGGE
jgi:membrane-associated protease RseP (regulator of RpoE activity)